MLAFNQTNTCRVGPPTNPKNLDPPRRSSSFCKLDAELLALEGAPSVSAALRALHESPSSPDTPAPPSAVRAAAELLLAYVTNALRDPRNPRVHRVRSGNPAFQRALGRLGGCEAAMTAVGFEPRDRGALFVLRERGAGGAGGRCSAAKEREEVSVVSWVARIGIMIAGRRVSTTCLVASEPGFGQVLPMEIEGVQAEHLADCFLI